MAAAHQGPDRTSEKVAEPDNMKEQPLSARNESSAPPSSAQDAATIGNSRDTTNQSGSFSSGGDHSVYPPNIYAPQAQAFYYRGFENPTGEWDEYPQFINAEGLEIGSSGIYNDNPSLMFHTGFGYSPQMPYGPYSPVTTPLPSVGGDGQLYSPQQFQFSGTPYYQQLVSPSMPYITSPTPVSQPELTTLVSEHQQHDGMLFGPRPCYPPPLGSFGRGNFPGNSGTLGFHDLQQGFDGFGSAGLWSDWSKPADRQRSFTPLSPAVSPQPTGTLGSFGSVGMASQQQRTLFGFGSGSNSYNRGYIPGGFNQGSSFGSASISSLGANGRGWFTFDNNKRRGRPSGALCSCNGTLDVLSEQNRGPRATKPKNQNTGEHSPPMETSKNSISNAKNQDDLYNRADFLTEYEDAKFFIIKSYSEDNVHKSIKYGVWASTPNGNRKLDAAYREAMEKQGTCPIFLFFSVNASAQFCGVAEMVGPVDFDKSVDYWQQDKWSGQFPVKWHIIKDVPNSQFRHIVLENNDKKPVTNSRDTQEVKLEQGIEMLNIFKNYETDVSILDDFDFYEERQKAMQERKARQQAGFMTGGGNECKNNGLSSDLMKQMSKSFAQAVRLEECSKEGTAPDRGSSASDGSVGTPTTTAPTS
ncbi:YTH domain-containing protein ECT4 isoform X2 [Malania oleifera]|uniref:YTH domain-containing protein ECT4 isoform X2 n=1 Tax=Malania oleifera TaxID=397392 RepID=UPI0025AE47E4|nr:YTH domain-containing protein ECT4 isoform X2 [Malania oleifera]